MIDCPSAECAATGCDCMIEANHSFDRSEARHAEWCDIHTLEQDDKPIACSCELGALRALAHAAGEIVRVRLLPCGNCQGDLEQALIDTHGRWLEQIV